MTVPMRPDWSRGQDLSDWFDADTDVWRLGHVSGPPHKHFSIFVNPGALLSSSKQEQIVGALLSKVESVIGASNKRLGWSQSRSISVALWHVSSESDDNDDDKVLADMVRDYLEGRNFKAADVTAIPRDYADQDWEFPSSVQDLEKPTGVLIVQFWTITGSTIPQLIRLAAKSGASWIAVVCLLNQLNDNKADELLMLRAVTRGAPNESDDTASDAESSEVSVATRFVASSGITAFDSGSCPICFTQDQYKLPQDQNDPSQDQYDPFEYYIPPRLSSHAKSLRGLLDCRKWQDVSRGRAVDLFNVPTKGIDTVAYLNWRKLLSQARRSVNDHEQVINLLRDLAGEKSVQAEVTSTGLIRLLAAEQQWLRVTPLTSRDATEPLYEICVGNFARIAQPPWLRIQSLVVVAAAWPDRFVESLQQFMTMARDEAVLVDQMLLDCYRLLLRAPDELTINVLQLRRSLLACRDDLENRLREPEATMTDDHLLAVRSLLAVADYRIITKPMSAQTAWDRLREDLVRPVVRHRLESELLLVRNFVEDCEWVEPSSEAVRAVATDWDTCARNLSEGALVNLPALRDILGGDFVADRFGRQDQQRLLTLAAERGVAQLQTVADRLHTLFRGGHHPEDPSWQAVRHELLERINWWNRIFLAAHVGDQERPALLVELIGSAPVKLSVCMDELLVSHHAQATVRARTWGEGEVFCPKTLLDQVLTHLLENINKHRALNAEGSCRVEIEYLPRTRNNLQMVVRNSGTKSNSKAGRGLEALNDKLHPFGGALTHQALSEKNPGGWTFAATITLPLWHGV
jgi:hypothetical protein